MIVREPGIWKVPSLTPPLKTLLKLFTVTIMGLTGGTVFMEDIERMHPFSIRLKAARKEMNYTQQELADLSGVSEKSIKRWENLDATEDKVPLANNLQSIALALDTSSEYLLCGNENTDAYMEAIKKELLALKSEEILRYHSLPLSDKAPALLRLTDEFTGEICRYWNKHTLRCYFPYVQDTILRYCHNRPKKRPAE